MGFKTAIHPLGGNFTPHKKGDIFAILDLKSAEANKTLSVTFETETSVRVLVKLVGGGGGDGGAYSNGMMYDGGGSGSCIIAEVRLPKGTYKVYGGSKGSPGRLNAGGSTVGVLSKLCKIVDGVEIELLIAKGGGNGYFAGGHGDIGRYEVKDTTIIKKEIKLANGNAGSNGGPYASVWGGESVFEGYGKGSGLYGSGCTGGLAEIIVI